MTALSGPQVSEIAATTLLQRLLKRLKKLDSHINVVVFDMPDGGFVLEVGDARTQVSGAELMANQDQGQILALITSTISAIEDQLHEHGIRYA